LEGVGGREELKVEEFGEEDRKLNAEAQRSQRRGKK
jgi:hypothetical protein